MIRFFQKLLSNKPRKNGEHRGTSGNNDLRIEEFNCTCLKPGGAFYIFPYFEGQNDVELADALLDAGVGTVPGSPFGTNGRGCIRLSYGSGDVKTLEEAFNRMATVKGIV